MAEQAGDLVKRKRCEGEPGSTVAQVVEPDWWHSFGIKVGEFGSRRRSPIARQPGPAGRAHARAKIRAPVRTRLPAAPNLRTADSDVTDLGACRPLIQGGTLRE